MSAPIAELELSPRAHHALVNAGVETVEQLVAMDRKLLLRVPHCGERTVKEIESVLAVSAEAHAETAFYLVERAARELEYLAAELRSKAEQERKLRAALKGGASK